MRSTSRLGRIEITALFAGWLTCVACSAGLAQRPRIPAPAGVEITFDASVRKDVAERFAQVLTEEYSYADQGAKMAQVIRSKLASGGYDSIASPSAFADVLAEDARSVTHDLHLRVSYSNGSGGVRIMRGGPPSPQMLAQLRKQNAAIPEVKVLEGNIGYMPVNGMLPAQAANDAIAAAFAFLHNTDALIIDLRANPGGSGYAEVYLSYLSEGAPYVTGSVHWRKDNRVQEFRTSDVGSATYGAKKPVYLLTSKSTFSAAEGLAYDIQALKRGVIVGETTGGGANPSAGGGAVQLGHGFSANVPTGYVVNAVTGTNWEGVGVKPDVQVPAEQALGKAWSLAAEKLKEGVTDPSAAAVLESISLAKLEGAPALTPAQIAGHYTPAGPGAFSGGRPLSITENYGMLYEERFLMINGARTTKTESLTRVGGDRYLPEGAPAGSSSQIFFIRDGKVSLLLIERMGARIWVRQT